MLSLGRNVSTVPGAGVVTRPVCSLAAAIPASRGSGKGTGAVTVVIVLSLGRNPGSTTAGGAVKSTLITGGNELIVPGCTGAGCSIGGVGMVVDGCGSSGSTAGFCSAGLRVVAIFYSYALFTQFFNHVV